MTMAVFVPDAEQSTPGPFRWRMNLAVKLRRDQRPECCPITLRCMSAVRASRAPARRQTDLTVVSSSPKCRAKATIIGYGQSKYPGLDGVRLARILALAR